MALDNLLQFVKLLLSTYDFSKQALKLIISGLLLWILLDVDELRRGACTLRTHEIDLGLGFLDLADAADLFLFLWVELLDLLQLRVDFVFDPLDQLRKLAEKLVVDPYCRGLFRTVFINGHQKAIL